MIAEMADDSSPDHSACGESSPNPASAAPAVGTKRRISQDSAQRVPECDAGAVPPGLDFELPKGPMDRQALAKTLWGKEFDVSVRERRVLSRCWLAVGCSGEHSGACAGGLQHMSQQQPYPHQTHSPCPHPPPKTLPHYRRRWTWTTRGWTAWTWAWTSTSC